MKRLVGRAAAILGMSVLALSVPTVAQAAEPVPAGGCTLFICVKPAPPGPQGGDKPPSGRDLRGCLGWGLGATALTMFTAGAAGPAGWLVASGACIDGLAGPE